MAKILLVEADRQLAQNISKILKRAGHRIDWQVDLQAALDSADGHQPDLVILDLVLAGRSGVEFLYEFRSYREWQSVPVIIYSAVAIADLGATSASLDDLTIGQFHYKPITDLEQLQASVADTLAAAPVTK